MMNFLTLAATSGTSSQAAGNGGALAMAVELLPIVAIVVLFYFMLIRPQKKKEKETVKMRNNIQVGDEITTVGGVVGRVVMIKEDSLIIETGADRNKIRIKKWAVQSNDTIHEESK